jgi:periplasmic protein TonB
MFDKTLLESSSERRPVLGPIHWLLSVTAGLLGFVVASMKLPVGAGSSSTQILLLRAAVLGCALMFQALAACYTYEDARRAGLKALPWCGAVVLGSLPAFLVYLVYSALKTEDWKRAAAPIAYTLEVFLVGVAALVPLIFTQALPGSFRSVTSVPVMPRGQRQGQPRPQRTPVHVSIPVAFTTPTEIPDRIPQFEPQPVQPPEPGIGVVGVPNGLGGAPDGVLNAILMPGSVPPPPAPKPKPAPVKRLVLGGMVEAAKAIYRPDPVYPNLAITARVQGTVRLRAVIGRDGTVQELRVLSGNPLLINSARDTVAKWRYQPTLLNGEPVEVETEIDVNFVLNN